jgi:hypothetical protein
MWVVVVMGRVCCVDVVGAGEKEGLGAWIGVVGWLMDCIISFFFVRMIFDEVWGCD